jgi:hypothetical protein
MLVHNNNTPRLSEPSFCGLPGYGAPKTVTQRELELKPVTTKMCVSVCVSEREREREREKERSIAKFPIRVKCLILLSPYLSDTHKE